MSILKIAVMSQIFPSQVAKKDLLSSQISILPSQPSYQKKIFTFLSDKSLDQILRATTTFNSSGCVMCRC